MTNRAGERAGPSPAPATASEQVHAKPMMNRPRERNVLISGASRGLGRALQSLYAQRRWRTFPLVRSEQAADELASQWPDNCRPIVTDVTDDETVERIRSVLRRRHADKVHVLVNNAGYAGRSCRVDELSSEEIEEMLAVHCMGALRCIQSALPFLRAAEGATIVNITSRLGSMARNADGEFAGKPFTYSYRIAKAAQNMLTLCLSQELKTSGIAVVGVHPGALLTDSRSHDADTTPQVAARRIADLVDRIDTEQTGTCFDAQGGTIPW